MQGIHVVGGCSNIGCLQQDGAFFSIQYLYPDETCPENRKRPKKQADAWKAKAEQPLRNSSIPGSPLLYKPDDFHDLYILLYIQWKAGHCEGTFVLHKIQIWDTLEAIRLGTKYKKPNEKHKFILYISVQHACLYT